MEKRIIAAFAVTEPLTKESFIEMMKTLWADASSNYRRIYDEIAVPNATAYNIAYFDRLMTTTEERARKFAEAKWKTEKRREQYVREELNKVMKRKNSWKPAEFRPLTYLDFDVNPGSNGISGNCCIAKFDDEHLGKCFDEIRDNEYFKSATMISIGYTESDSRWEAYHDGLCHFRPQVYLTLPVELEKKWKDEANALAESIREFYATCHYCGD